MMQYATLDEDTVYFWFGANNTSGSGADGSSPVYDVRLGGAASSAAPVESGSATLLTHASYPDGCHEIAIAPTTAGGYASGNTYGVFCTLLVDSQNPTGFVGAFRLKPVTADVRQWIGVAVGSTQLGYPDVYVIGHETGAITASSIASNAITSAKIAAGAITAAGIATGAIDADALAADAGTEIGTAVWAAASRTLTASTNFNDLSAADIRSALGLAAANLDTQLDALPTANENADALLGRNIAGGSSTGRTVSTALYALRNKVTISGGTMTVYTTDDTTISWTATTTSDAAADPITAMDPG